MQYLVVAVSAHSGLWEVNLNLLTVPAAQLLATHHTSPSTHSVTWSPLSHGPLCHSVPSVTWSPLSHGPLRHMVPSVTRSPLSHGPLCHMVPSVTWSPLSHGPLCHSVSFVTCQDPEYRHKPRLMHSDELPLWLLKGDEEVSVRDTS